MTSHDQIAPHPWPDAYLTAFAKVAGITLVTLDRALARMASGDAFLLS